MLLTDLLSSISGFNHHRDDFDGLDVLAEDHVGPSEVVTDDPVTRYSLALALSCRFGG